MYPPWNTDSSSGSYSAPHGQPSRQNTVSGYPGGPTSGFPIPDGQSGYPGYSSGPRQGLGPPPGNPYPPQFPLPIRSVTYPGPGIALPEPGHLHAGFDGVYVPTPGPPRPPPQGQQFYGPQFQGSQERLFFEYSQCTGRKKALCIGINYIGQPEQSQLRGCIDDARKVERFLCEKFGYMPDDIVVLTDDQQDPRSRPTKNNMIGAMYWLVKDAKPNDSLFFHYSGHGGQTKDLDGDEEDGYDEVIYPVDYKTAKHIVDDLMHDIMVKPLPPGCRLTAIFDCCHSGSALDLPYVYSTEGNIKEPNLLRALINAGSYSARGEIIPAFRSVMAATSGREAMQRARQTKTSPADVISLGACKDSQKSADAAGAMSRAFIRALTERPQQSYQELLMSMRTILSERHNQKPQLSSSHPMDTTLQFIA